MASSPAVKDEFTEVVKAYKYVSPNLSLFEQLFLNDFWAHVTELYPFWLAPNIITLVGGSCALTSYLILWILSPQALGTAPYYCYYIAAFLFFAYQTLDGSDGKQARRTGSGSALGEMMDHGVDAVVTGFLGVVAVDAMGFGLTSFAPWICIFGAQMAFFLSNLTLLHRGRQTFFMIDIMELQWAMITTLIITGTFGVDIWRTNLTLPNLMPDLDELIVILSTYLSMASSTAASQGTKIELRFIFAIGSAGGIIANFVAYTLMAFSPYLLPFDRRPDGVKKNVPGTGVIPLLHQLIVIVSFGSLGMLCRYRIATSTVLNDSMKLDALRALVFTSCYAIGDIMDRFLIMRVAQQPVPMVPPSLAILSAFCVIIGYLSVDPRLSQLRIWWIFALSAQLMHMLYFVFSGSKLARALDVHPFKVKEWKRKWEEVRSKKS
jgi:phosphatidylglycerophosphate synthase